MNDFNEAILTVNVNIDVADVYKKAIESENSPQWKRNPVFDDQGQTISNDLNPVWNGNYASVVIGNRNFIYLDDKPIEKNTVKLTIQLISHTLPNLKETVKWYEKMGCKIIRVNY